MQKNPAEDDRKDLDGGCQTQKNGGCVLPALQIQQQTCEDKDPDDEFDVSAFQEKVEREGCRKRQQRHRTGHRRSQPASSQQAEQPPRQQQGPDQPERQVAGGPPGQLVEHPVHDRCRSGIGEVGEVSGGKLLEELFGVEVAVESHQVGAEVGERICALVDERAGVGLSVPQPRVHQAGDPGERRVGKKDREEDPERPGERLTPCEEQSATRLHSIMLLL